MLANITNRPGIDPGYNNPGLGGRLDGRCGAPLSAFQGFASAHLKSIACSSDSAWLAIVDRGATGAVRTIGQVH